MGLAFADIEVADYTLVAADTEPVDVFAGNSVSEIDGYSESEVVFEIDTEVGQEHADSIEDEHETAVDDFGVVGMIFGAVTGQ